MKIWFGAFFKITAYGKHFNFNIFKKTAQKDILYIYIYK